MRFQFAPTFKPGCTTLLSDKAHPEINMNVTAIVLKQDESFHSEDDQERILVLCQGTVAVMLQHQKTILTRSDVFYGEPALVHVPPKVSFSVTGMAAYTELIMIATDNARDFQPRVMQACDCLNPKEIRAVGQMNDAAIREARTYLDRSTVPETNFFIGEVVMAPGKWSSFPPHHHPETEIYFYKFLPENGYGYAEVDGDVEIVRHHSLHAMVSNECHPQVTTPGYAEWYLWCIRLSDHEALNTQFDPEHSWLNDPDACIFPNCKPRSVQSN